MSSSETSTTGGAPFSCVNAPIISIELGTATRGVVSAAGSGPSGSSGSASRKLVTITCSTPHSARTSPTRWAS